METVMSCLRRVQRPVHANIITIICNFNFKGKFYEIKARTSAWMDLPLITSIKHELLNKEKL